MISKKLNQAICEQMRYEFYSAYYYLSMAAWLDAKNLKGFANWYYVQTQEEKDHAKMMLDYLLRVGGQPEFLPIDQPPSNFESTMDICRKTLEHEQLVTSKIYQLMDFAQEEKDYKTIQFLQWYVNEQTEEEENAQGLIERLTIAGNSEGGILYMDSELAARVYTPTTLATAT
ncbi:MAG: ferritin [Christensenellaceae bacterium]|jgi:ferritin